MLRCKDIPYLDGLVLEMDFDTFCYETVHMHYVFATIGAIIVYIIGFPIGIWLILFRNRDALHYREDEDDDDDDDDDDDVSPDGSNVVKSKRYASGVLTANATALKWQLIDSVDGTELDHLTILK